MDTSPITSRWPPWRTNPAGTATAGGAPVLTAVLAVVIGGPLIGGALLLIGSSLAAVLDDSLLAFTLQSVGFLLIVSLAVSWAVLLVAIPLAMILAARGLAGWSVAAVTAVLIGTAMTVIFEEALTPDAWVAYTATALILAALCWLSVRQFHPAFLGIARKSLV